MNKNSTFLRPNFLILALFAATSGFSQASGDYQTIASGNWNGAATWARYNGTSWVNTATPPTSADGAISILNSHTVTLTAAVTADQLTVNSGGTLTLNTNTAHLTLVDGAGTDLTVNGTLNLGLLTVQNNILGAGTVVINGNVNWSYGNFAVPTTVSATGIVNLVGVDQPKRINTTFTNNGVINWNTGTTSGGIFFNNGTLTNNGTINEIFSSNRGFLNESGTNSFVNNGIFNKTTTFQFANLGVPFTNSSTGILRGKGIYNLDGTIVNAGTVAPGNSPGSLTVNPATINGKTPTLSFEIEGGTQGTQYDHLTVNNSLIVTGSKLVVAQTAPGAPLQTYTLISVSTGSITGTFASTSIPAGYILNYTPGGTTVSVTRTSVLPLTWGAISAAAENTSSVKISFSTLQEINTKDFVIEHSLDGHSFSAVGTVAAAGNTTTTRNYSFVHTAPGATQNNYYRIKQIDLDGQFTYSKTIEFRFNSKNAVSAVVLKENPVKASISFNVNEARLNVRLTDLSGRQYAVKNVQPGVETIDVSSYPSGIYVLAVYNKGELVQQLKVVKQ